MAETLFELLRAWSGEGQLQLTDDEPETAGGMRFGSGVADSVLGGTRDDNKVAYAEHAVFLLKESAAGNAEKARAALDSFARERRVISVIDEILPRVLHERLDHDKVRADGRWLIEHARHRGAMKLGIGLVGISGTEEDKDDLLMIGRHEEFTLYAVVALSNMLRDPTDAIWELARRTEGWGKIHAVTQLAKFAEDRPDVRDWIIRDGCENAVMNDELGLICARGGRLADALEPDRIDSELLDGALVIGVALCAGFPGQELYDYEDGPVAMSRLVCHLRANCDTVRRLHSAMHIERWLKNALRQLSADSEKLNDVEDRERLVDHGWTIDGLLDSLGLIGDVFEDPQWPDRLRSAFTPDDPERYVAWGVSERVGIDLWPLAWDQLQERPDESILYYWLLDARHLDGDRAARVVEFAATHLPLEELASGPSTHSLEPRRQLYQASHALDYVLFAIARTGVLNDDIVSAGLRSPAVRNRNIALRVLDEHEGSRTGAKTRAALAALLDDEPNEKTRAKLAEVIAKLD